MGCAGCITTLILGAIIYLLFMEGVGLGELPSLLLTLLVLLALSFARGKIVFYQRTKRQSSGLDNYEGISQTLVSVECPSCKKHVYYAAPGSFVHCPHCRRQLKAKQQ